MLFLGLENIMCAIDEILLLVDLRQTELELLKTQRSMQIILARKLDEHF